MYRRIANVLPRLERDGQTPGYTPGVQATDVELGTVPADSSPPSRRSRCCAGTWSTKSPASKICDEESPAVAVLPGCGARPSRQWRTEQAREGSAQATAPSTRKIYLGYTRLFAKHHTCARPPRWARRRYRAVPGSTYCTGGGEEDLARDLPAIRAALIFLHTITLKCETEVDHLPVRRKKVELPVVLSGTAVQTLLDRSAVPRTG